jgi:HEAT repeat protein
MKRYVLALAVLWAGFPAAAQDPNDPDRRKTAMAVYAEGLRFETDKPVNLQAAIGKYKKALQKAKDEKNNDVAAAALVRMALCNEKLEPENIGDAKAAYDEVVSSYAETKPWGEIAKEKVSFKGVDVWLRQLHHALEPWRISLARSALDPLVVDKKTAAWDKIKPLDKEAVAGLVWGTGHPDEVIRNFAAESLAEVVDESGIAAVIARLNDPAPQARAGASTALQKIYRKWNDAASHDRRADELDRDLNVPLRDDSRAKGHHDKLKAESDKARKVAAEIRHNIPANLATPEIQGALQKIIEDEAAHVQARRDAAQAAAYIGRISGPLVDAILKGMTSKDRNVREACCRAAGAVDTSISADKHKLADGLIASLRYEPAKAAGPDNTPPGGADAHPDWANDEAVRQAAAEALEDIALVKSLPALIETLDDNDARVRHAAFRSLREITRRDLDYGKDDKGNVKTYEPDKPLEERKQGKEKWDAWWNDTKGIVVLVERFWSFQSQWKDTAAVKLFEPEAYMKEVASRRWTVTDPKADEDRANRVKDEFQHRKNVFVQDGVDIGPEALDQLVKFIGGETQKEAKPNAATRYFVAETCARIVEKHNVGNGVERIRQILIEGDNAAKKAGAALSLGFIPKDKIGASERQALQDRGLGAGDVETKEAAGIALAKVGDDTNAAALTAAAGDADASVQIAALRALSAIHPMNPDTVKALGDMVADEPEAGVTPKKSRDKNVREHATDALGAIGDPAGMAALIRARRDEMKNVREAAILAVRKVHQADPKAASETALGILRDERKKTDDRIGAALALGDMGDPVLGKELSGRLIDVNPPRILKDQDAGVRIKICEGLGNMGEKGKIKSVAERLLSSMGSDDEREAVRDAAYQALKAITGIDPDREGTPDAAKKFKASDPKPARDGAIKSWMDWYNTEGKNLTDPA